MIRALVPAIVLLFFTPLAYAEDSAALLKEIEALRAQILQIETLKARLTELEARVMEKETAQKNEYNEVVIQLEGSSNDDVGDDESSMQDRVQIHGVVEAEAAALEEYEGDRENGLAIATVAVAIEAQISPSTVAVATFLYEEGDTPFDLDEAFISHGRGDATYAIGHIYLPFGVFESSMISDPLTLGLSESLETAALYQRQMNDWAVSAYLFNGESDGEGRLNQWGTSLNYEAEHSGLTWLAELGYISNVLGSDGLGEIDYSPEEDASAANVALQVFGSRFGVTLEHVTVLESLPLTAVDFNGREARPSATHLEAATTIPLARLHLVTALAYQFTDEMLFVGFPERRVSLSLASEVVSGIAVSLEVFREYDYDATDFALGEFASGEAQNGFVVQIATEF